MEENKAETKKKTKKTAVEKVEKTEKTEAKVKSKITKNWEGKSLSELKLELQRLHLDLKTGQEKNTSLSRKLKKHIAKELTKLNLQK